VEVVKVDETPARPGATVFAVANRRPRRNFTILWHAIESANLAEKALIQA
jgi:hypothetical protein